MQLVTPTSVEQVAHRFNELLYQAGAPRLHGLEEPNQVCIVAGHANHTFYRLVEDALKRVHHYGGTQISVVAGPILSVDDNYDSPLLRLARERVATLYVSPYRQRNHFRILTGNLEGIALQIEDRHLPSDTTRRVQEVDGTQTYNIACHIAEFNGIVEVICSKWSGDDVEFIKLRDPELTELKWSEEDDFMDRDELVKKIQATGIRLENR